MVIFKTNFQQQQEVLWYMGKEIDIKKETSRSTVVESTNSQFMSLRPRIYSFFAPLMLSGNAPSELSVYPSQTSVLLHQNQAWGSLRGSTDGMVAPTLEVLVGGD